MKKKVVMMMMMRMRRRMLEPPKTAGQCQDIGIRRCVLIDNG